MATTTTATMMLLPLLMAMALIQLILGDQFLEHLKAIATTLLPIILIMTRRLLPVKLGMRRRLLWNVTASCFLFKLHLAM